MIGGSGLLAGCSGIAGLGRGSVAISAVSGASRILRRINAWNFGSSDGPTALPQ